MKKALTLLALFVFCAVPAALFLLIGILAHRAPKPIDFRPEAPWKRNQ